MDHGDSEAGTAPKPAVTHVLSRLKMAKAAKGAGSPRTANTSAQIDPKGEMKSDKEGKRNASSLLNASKAMNSLKRGSKMLAAGAKKKYSETARKAFIKAKAAMKNKAIDGAGTEGGPEFDPESFEPKFDFEVLGVRTRDVILTENTSANRDEGRFGVTVAGGHRDTDIGVQIVGISNVGSAAALGNVYVGDVILEVNGLLVLYNDPEEVEEMIRFATGDSLRLKLAASADLRACLQSEDSVEDHSAVFVPEEIGESAAASIMACLFELETVHEPALNATEPVSGSPKPEDDIETGADLDTPPPRTIEDFLEMGDREVPLIDETGFIESETGLDNDEEDAVAVQNERQFDLLMGSNTDLEELHRVNDELAREQELACREQEEAEHEARVRAQKLAKRAEWNTADKNWRSEQARRTVASQRLQQIHSELAALSSTSGMPRQDKVEAAVRESELLEEVHRIESVLAAPTTCSPPPPLSPDTMSLTDSSEKAITEVECAQTVADQGPIDESAQSETTKVSESDSDETKDVVAFSQENIEPVVNPYDAVSLSGSQRHKNKMGTYHFNGQFSSDRPVYEHGKWKLYYLQKCWRIGPDSASTTCSLRNKTPAEQPQASKVNWHETVRAGSDIMTANAAIRAIATSSKTRLQVDAKKPKKAQQDAARRVKKHGHSKEDEVPQTKVAPPPNTEVEIELACALNRHIMSPLIQRGSPDAMEEKSSPTHSADPDSDTFKGAADLTSALSDRSTNVWSWSIDADQETAADTPVDDSNTAHFVYPVGSMYSTSPQFDLDDDFDESNDRDKSSNTLRDPVSVSPTKTLTEEESDVPASASLPKKTPAVGTAQDKLDGASTIESEKKISQSAQEWLAINQQLQTKMSARPSCPFSGCPGCKDPIVCAYNSQYNSSMLVTYLRATEFGLLRDDLLTVEQSKSKYDTLMEEATKWVQSRRAESDGSGPVVVHSVTSLDTLQGLAVKYETTTSAIRKRNKMTTNDVISYATLIIPTTSATAQEWTPSPEPHALSVLVRIAFINHFLTVARTSFDEARVLLDLNNFDVEAALSEHKAWAATEIPPQPPVVQRGLQEKKPKTNDEESSFWGQLNLHFSSGKPKTQPSGVDEPSSDERNSPTPILEDVTLARTKDETSFGFQLTKDKKHHHLTVSRVDRGGPAQRAGLRNNDIVWAIEGTRLLKDASLEDAVKAIRAACEGRNPPYVALSCSTPLQREQSTSPGQADSVQNVCTVPESDLTVVELKLREQATLLAQVHDKMTQQLKQATDLGFGADEIVVIQEEVGRLSSDLAKLKSRPLARQLVILRSNAPDGHNPGFRLENNQGTASVSYIEEGGAADFAGLKKGELLMEVDGSDVYEMDINSVGDRIQACGSEIRLGVASIDTRPKCKNSDDDHDDQKVKAVVSKSLTLAFDQLKEDAETTLDSWKEGWKQLTSSSSRESASGYGLIKEKAKGVTTSVKISPEMLAASMKRVSVSTKGFGRDFGLRLSLTTSGQRLVEVLSVKDDSPFFHQPRDNPIMPGDVLIAVGKYTLRQEYATVAAAMDLLECTSVPYTACFVSKVLVPSLPLDPVALEWIVKQSAETTFRSRLQKWRTELAIKEMEPPKVAAIPVNQLDDTLASATEATASYVLGSKGCLMCKMRPKDTVLGCGHSFCQSCTQRMHKCPVKLCGRMIMTRTPMSHRHRSSLDEKASMGNGLFTLGKGEQVTPLPTSVPTMAPLGPIEDENRTTPPSNTPMKDAGQGLLSGSWQVAKSLEFEKSQEECAIQYKSPKKKKRGVTPKKKQHRLVEVIEVSQENIPLSKVNGDVPAEVDNNGDAGIYSL
eukprot:m.273544 g.273544  ORF g.273544 m.273544 type:complete len:1823 (+) comp16120_c0_seq1:228-5696(+)